jgi:hypothetical protein
MAGKRSARVFAPIVATIVLSLGAATRPPSPPMSR